jgi:hypothetical protein
MARVDWLPWNYNNGYINKYHSQSRYSENHSIRANYIDELKFYHPIKNNNGKWELSSYDFK